MITWKNNSFYLDEKPFQIMSGAIHYFRTLPEQWEERLYALKCIGFNTVETYCCWNLHEPVEGTYCFDGRLDIEHFIEISQKLGLYVIVRPGPYICAEWDFGGMPAWLLKDRNIRFRSCDPEYFEKAAKYMRVLLGKIVPHLYSNGGNVILVAVENEYGSFSNSHQYMNACEALLRECGVDVPIFTADGHTPMSLIGGSAEHAVHGLDFGYNGDVLPEHTDSLKSFYPDEPLLHAEHWMGGLTHWGHSPRWYSPEFVVKEMKTQLQMGMNFNLYMFHGGTDFGFMNGANAYPENAENLTETNYYPDVTSYELDGMLTECGDITEKYAAVHQVMENHLKRKLPWPKPHGKQQIGKVTLTETADLMQNTDRIGDVFHDEFAQNMEAYGQGYGYILYRCKIEPDMKIDRLAFENVCDRITVYFNHSKIGVLEPNDKKRHLEIDGLMEPGGVLELLVENQGRVNFGPGLLHGERKGINGYVFVRDYVGIRQILSQWEIITLPMERLDSLKFGTSGYGPHFYRGTFQAEPGKDCFVSPDGFTKGFIVVNGFNIGRYWKIGPQKELYLPWPILRENNEIIVFDEEETEAPYVNIVDQREHSRSFSVTEEIC